LSGVRPNVQSTLFKSGFRELIGEDNICSHINVALAKAKEIIADK